MNKYGQMHAFRRFAGVCLSVLLAMSFLPASAIADTVPGPAAADAPETLPTEPASDLEAVQEPVLAPEPDSAPEAETAPDAEEPLYEATENAEGAKADPAESASERREAPLAEGVYVVRPASSASRVIDVSGGSAADGANVQLWSSNMTSAQRFKLSCDEDGFYTLVSVGSGKALDVAWGDASDGANIWQYAPNGSEAQRWALLDNRDGTYVLESALSSDMVLDVSGAADLDGANMQLYSANATAAQRFEFIPATPDVAGGRTVDDGVYVLRNVGSGKVLDIESASESDGARAQIYSANASLAQMFSLKLGSDGFYSVRALCSGKALDADLGNVVPGARVQQWAWCGSRNQKWAVSPASDGSFALICAANALALDVAGGGSANGTSVQTYTPNGTGAQRWTLEKVDSLLSDGIYAIESRLGSNRVLDIAAGSPYDGAGLQIWKSNATPAQRFKLTVSGDDGAFTLEALCSGLLVTARGCSVVQAAPDVSDPSCQLWRAVPAAGGGIAFLSEATHLALDVAGARDADGTSVGVYEPNGTMAQSFSAVASDPAGAGCYVLRSGADGRVLDVTFGSREDGANVQTWTENGTSAQKWMLKPESGGFCTLVSSNSGKALDVEDFSTSSGANVQQWSATGGSNQRWNLEYVGGGRFSLVSAGSGLYLDASGGFDGANVCVRTGDGEPAQSFRLEPASCPSGAVKRSDGSWDWYNGSGILDREEAVGRLMSTAHSLLGVPYVWDGMYPQDGGMDCSSFTWYVYHQLGIDLGEDTYHQIHDGYQVGSISEALPGDLILMYFGSHPNYDPSLPEHVVLYAGDGMIYEEPNFGGHCQYVPLFTKGANYIHIRRILYT